MAKASITLEDTESGLTVEADFGEKFDNTSRSHNTIDYLVHMVLQSSKGQITQIEDTTTPAKETDNGV